MKNEKLQPSELLTKYFAPRREEAPMLSAPEIEKLLERAMLPNPSRNTFNIRRIIMTLSGITGLGIAAYFAFFNGPSSIVKGTQRAKTTQGPYVAHPSHLTTMETKTAAPTPEKQFQPTVKPRESRGPWSAGNDQIYADLTPEELARLGIVVKGDTVLAYKLNNRDSVACTQLSVFPVKDLEIEGHAAQGHSIGGAGIFAHPPNGVYAPKFYPSLMTFSNGNGAAYRIEESGKQQIGITDDGGLEKQFRAWLQKPGIPGYYALGFTRVITREEDDGTRHDTVWLSVGKNLPQPALFPLVPPQLDGYSDSVMQSLLALAHFYDGSSATKLATIWPKTLTIKVDTVTAKNMLDMIDSEENNSANRTLRSITARLNELIPIIVRPHGGTGAPDSNDFIFWYEPSEELFSALPPNQARMFQKKNTPECMNTPEAVTATAEVTYCVTEPQQVQVNVFDLSGHIVMSLTQMAESGDNIAHVDMRSLPSGIYIVSVRDENGSQRTRRVWVQNAHPSR